MVEKREIKELKKKGLIIVHTGNGKGKTTAALGTAFRAMGYGWKTLVIQWIKGNRLYGELNMAEKLKDLIEIIPMGEGFTWETQDRKRDTEVANKAWEFCKEKILSGKYQIVILDEINNAIDYGYLDVKEVVSFLKEKKPPDLHIFLTGRNAKPEIVEIADLVTEMREIKHPFQQGIPAQKGIEF